MSSLDKDVRAIAVYEGTLQQGILTSQDRSNMSDIINRLLKHRPDIFEASFGPEAYARYQDYLNKCASPDSTDCKSGEKDFDPDLLARMKDF